jgi:uncharacterized protein VirK/YbjX
LRAADSLFFPRKVLGLWFLQFLKPYFSHTEKPDLFFFLTHNYYLSKNLTVAQRVDCAVTHYSHESRSCGSSYHRAVYRSAAGLILWDRTVHGSRYALTLRATEDFRTEGDLSILCLVNDVRVCRLSFAYVRGAAFGLDSAVTMFVTRNQTDRNAELQLFREHFKQNSPPYFCVAAVCGIAMAHGIPNICLVADHAQIAYDRRYAAGFKNSYSELWQAFGAEELVGRQAYMMSIPLSLNPLTSVKHKNRAIARRQNWLDIMVNARRIILQHRLARFPSPIDFETSESPPFWSLNPLPGGSPNGSETLRLDP